MFFIFGAGKQTAKRIGKVSEKACRHCHALSRHIVLKIDDWLTFFFIPIFPYMTRYALLCPRCEIAHEMTEDEHEELAGDLQPMERNDPVYKIDIIEFDDDDDDVDKWVYRGYEKREPPSDDDAEKYEGKNARQIAYLAKLEARDREMEALRDKEEREAKEASAASAASATSEAGMANNAVETLGEWVMDGAQKPRGSARPHDARHGRSARAAEAWGMTRKGSEAIVAVIEAWEIALDVRGKALDARETAMEVREKALEAREKALQVQEKALEVRERTLAVRIRARMMGEDGEDGEDGES